MGKHLPQAVSTKLILLCKEGNREKVLPDKDVPSNQDCFVPDFSSYKGRIGLMGP